MKLEWFKQRIGDIIWVKDNDPEGPMEYYGFLYDVEDGPKPSVLIAPMMPVFDRDDCNILWLTEIDEAKELRPV